MPAKIINILKQIIPFILLSVSVYLTYKTTGVRCHGTQFAAMMLFVIVLSSSKKSFWFILLPIFLFSVIYSPIGLTFGGLNYQYVASIFATDTSEAKEFLNQIPIENWFYSLVILGTLFLYRYLTKKFHIQYLRNKTLMIILVSVAVWNGGPFDLIKSAYSSSNEVKAELEKLNNLQLKSDWGVSKTTDDTKYQDYIVVIGESVRRDYMNLYGYPINDTPFMDTTNGVFIDGLESGGTNTIASLRLMLTHGDKQHWQPNYSLNIIDLAKSAGFETYWISNQGYIGKYDTPVTAIANRSDHKNFIKYGTSESINTSDYLLLPRLQNILSKKTTRKRLIIIHTYGSHPYICERIKDFKNNIKAKSKNYDYIACYLNSIEKTDDLLAKIYAQLQQNYAKNKRGFSMVYFADHGLSHANKDDEVFLNNGNLSKFQFDIPLMKFSSDDKDRQTYKAFKSGLMFTDGLATWMGISNSQLTPYDLFSPQSMDDDYGWRKKADTGKNDPTVDGSHFYKVG